MALLITGSRRSVEASSTSSRISSDEMVRILENLKSTQTRESTGETYHSIWRQFNQFIIKLDKKPKTWEERVALYGAFLVQTGIQSSTLKSYVSAIKCILRSDNYDWCDDRLSLTILTRACKLKNDRVRTRLPIQLGLLEILLHEMERYFGMRNCTSKNSPVTG